jgi:hypothetical protein
MTFAVLAFVLLVAVAYVVARPLILPEVESETTDVSALAAQKERVLETIRDLDMDFATGKLSEADYRGLRARYVAEAATTLEALDRTNPDSVSSGNGHGAPAPLEGRALGSLESGSVDDLEERIAARKAALERRSCPSCGEPRGERDRFCRGCGEPLLVAERDGHDEADA